MPEDTDNPVFEVENPPKSDGDMNEAQDAVAAPAADVDALLRDSFSPAQAAALRAAFGTAETTERLVSNSVWGELARSKINPSTWHQATVFVCASSDPEDAAYRPYLFGVSCLMVLLQLAAAVGALRNTQHVACTTNDQCTMDGMFCEVFAEKEAEGDSLWARTSSLKQANRCTYCGRGSPVPLQLNVETGEVYNRPAETHGYPTGPDEMALPQDFIRSGLFTEQGTFWRQDWQQNSGGTSGPVGVSAEALADPVTATGTIEAGWNWTTVSHTHTAAYTHRPSAD
jgi:hypothetical protein